MNTTASADAPRPPLQTMRAMTAIEELLRSPSGSNLTATQMLILLTVQRWGPLSIGQMAKELCCSQPNATTHLRRMRGAGLVQLDAGVRIDRRLTLVSLTEQGRAVARILAGEAV